MKQVLFGMNTGSSPTGTEYSSIMGQPLSWGTEAVGRSPWPAPGVLRNLIVEVVTAPGAGTSRTFTLRKGGANTALTVTISDTATTARLTGTDVPVAVGDLLALQATLSGVPAATISVRWSLEFEGTTAKESGYSAMLGGSNATTRAAGVFVLSGSTSTTAVNARNVVAAAGTLTGMVASVTAAPGVGNGFTFYVNKNGTRQDGTGGTVNTACALTGAITAVSVTYSLPLAAGDVVYTEAVASGAFTTRNWAVGVSFVATTDGESQLCGVVATALSTTTTQFCLVPSAQPALGATETSFAGRAIGGVASVVVTGLQVLLQAAPGSGKSRTIDLRTNAASAGPTVTISDAATTGSDLGNSATIADGDLWNLRFVPTSTPAAAIAHWGCIQRPISAAVARSTPFVGLVIGS